MSRHRTAQPGWTPAPQQQDPQRASGWPWRGRTARRPAPPRTLSRTTAWSDRPMAQREMLSGASSCCLVAPSRERCRRLPPAPRRPSRIERIAHRGVGFLRLGRPTEEACSGHGSDDAQARVAAEGKGGLRDRPPHQDGRRVEGQPGPCREVRRSVSRRERVPSGVLSRRLFSFVPEPQPTPSPDGAPLS